MSQPLSTIFVTDVPFWEQKTGAHLRISQLVDAFNISPFSSHVLLTQLNPETDFESVQTKFSRPLTLIDPSEPPQSGISAKAKWYIRALANQIGVHNISRHQPTFERYYPQAIVDRFLLDVQQDVPDVLVFEYVNQIQLLRALPQEIRRKTVCVVDTHDVLWRRAEQFREHKQKHWIDVGTKEEEKALTEFDLVIAIQNEEEAYFSSFISPSKVITTGMEFDLRDKHRADINKQKLVLGLMASNNWANVDTVVEILSLWPAICELNPNLEFLLAGSVCSSEKVRLLANDTQRFRMLGNINSPNDFYGQVDAIWNPVRFGTGLKIKNLEALSFAKCLITSPHGATGMVNFHENQDTATSQPFVILESNEATLEFFKGLNQDLIQTTSHSGTKHLESHFGAGTQYPKLRQKVASLYSSKSS